MSSVFSHQSLLRAGCSVRLDTVAARAPLGGLRAVHTYLATFVSLSDELLANNQRHPHIAVCVTAHRTNFSCDLSAHVVYLVHRHSQAFNHRH